MRKFFKTVAVVTVFSISEKFLGFLYRIFLSRTIGAEGVGLYQVALSVFALLVTLSCSGTPITVSRLMTKYKSEGDTKKVSKIISAGLLVTLITAIPLCIFFFLLRNNLSFLFADDRCINIFLVVLPGLIFTSVYAVLRGVFWGNKDFLPYSIIELLEEVCMIVVGIVLISRVTDVYQGAYSAGVAVLVSYLFSFALGVAVFFIRKNKLTNPKGQLKPLIHSSLPITAMRTANSLAMSLVSIVLPMRLIWAGYTSQEAMSMFGSALGQAIPILFIPTTLIGSFTLVLVPEIAENFYRKKFNYLCKDIEKSIKVSVIIACLFVPVFMVLGQQIGILVFDNHESGKYLMISSFLMILMSVSNISTSVLNSVGMENKTLLYFIISAIFMLISIWFLPAVCGIYSLLVGFTFVFGLTTVLNLILLNKICPIKPNYMKFSITAILLTIPAILFGFALKGILLPYLGNTLTLFVCATLIEIFLIILYLGFGLVKIDYVKKFSFKKIKKTKKPA